jgi:transcriptional regulator with XRE-family HTH domain
MDESYIQERIVQLRMNKGVSAREMSIMLGQAESYINMIENKKSIPSMTVFLNICDYFKITPKEFFDSDNKDPDRLNTLVADLKKLDAKYLTHIEGLVKELTGK